MATASVKRSASTDSKRSHSGHRYEKVAAKLRDPRLQRERCSPGASQLRPPTRPILQYHQRTPTAMKTPIPCFPPPSPPVDIYVAPTMERTLSGHSIVSDHNISMPPPVIHDHTILSDDQAANLIEHHFRYDPPPDHYYLEVELQNLLLKAHLSDRAIDRIIYLVDTIFFHNSLHNRVRLSWSSPEQPRYSSELIGTTALRLASFGGFETLIVLSEPILRDPKYDRRLLLSALLHELVHCYLFVKCGWEAKQMGGHTDGFHRVVGVIDAWVERWIGRDWLRLCSMRANLEFFRVHTEVCVPLSRGVGEERRTSAWEDNGNGNGNGEVRERERSWGIHHHGHHRHSGCGQSPGPGTERALRFSRDFIPYVGDEEGFR
ncbi:hypothetical protein sscle_05g041560 [Sclerotinia sclerotiorum 1980 UF-70]|uniref:SprT-like domain-containing protein n=1 Tax=Sclerotinia sclerotiorum (strain ATCC 18683 / 1980 / Ss-1) TaxID=665079 RepID=A0A1D9Q3B3_SCLS1|nr:hypothetical protein sscle_05g041560 [Sclerotinia sclerotiorum 1980 UF-70]